jgi:hypothetical protein
VDTLDHKQKVVYNTRDGKMDVLLSLPIVSYFFSTSLTSWSTSLNLLFFYMTWSTLVLSQSPLRMEIVGTAVLRIAFWLLPSVVFLTFDTLLPSLAENIKYNGAAALPPRDARLLAKLTSLALLNLALESTIQAAVSLGLATFLHAPVFRTSTTLPLPWQMIKHIALLYAGREFLTYYIHRHLLHGHPAPVLAHPKSSNNALTRLDPRKAKVKTTTPSPTLTSLHTRYAHARRAPPYSLLLRADHPLPYLLHRFVPLYLPALALALTPHLMLAPRLSPFPRLSWTAGTGLHLLTFLLFVCLTTLEETLALSGYTVVPGILLGGMARRAAVHYAAAPAPAPASSFSVKAGSAGKGGNFGNWGVLDWVHGTSLGGDVMADLRDEAEKHQLRERGEDKADELGKAVRGGVEGLRRNGRSRGRKAKAQELED